MQESNHAALQIKPNMIGHGELYQPKTGQKWPENPVVSICITCFQHIQYIEDCVAGMLAQKTNFPFEIIIGEDASTDGSKEKLIELADANPHIIKLYLRSQLDSISINGNKTGRFNIICNIMSAKGKYIAICDGDDYWINDQKLQTQFDTLENNPNSNVVFTVSKVVNNEGKHLYNFPKLTEATLVEFNRNDFITHNPLGENTSSSFFRKEIGVAFIHNKGIVEFSAFDRAFWVFATKDGPALLLPHIWLCRRVTNMGLFTKRSEDQRLLFSLDFYYEIKKHLLNTPEEKALIDKGRIDFLNKYFGKKFTKKKPYVILMLYKMKQKIFGK